MYAVRPTPCVVSRVWLYGFPHIMFFFNWEQRPHTVLFCAVVVPSFVITRRYPLLCLSCQVIAEVEEQTKEPKIIVLKKKRRKGQRRTHGHRRAITVLRISDIVSPSPAAVHA